LPTEPDLVLVDGPVAPALTIPCWPVVRGDQRSRVIACASIVAKVVRDGLMAFYHELYPGYHFGRHKGYGTSLHARALDVLGPSPLHRRSFKPVAADQARRHVLEVAAPA
jgi:ribonuclease HII